jgi:hypothetical protein
MDLTEISTRLGVADLLARYQRLADSGKLDELVALFAPAAVFENNTNRFTGSGEIAEFFRATGHSFVDAGIMPGRHHLATILVDPGPEPGTATTYATFVWIGRYGPDHWGTYRDEVAEIDGRWRFRRRRAIIDGQAASSPVPELLGLPATADRR